jgi:hypothetical protein
MISSPRLGLALLSLLFAFAVPAAFSAPLRWSDPATWQRPGFRVATCNDLSCACVPDVPIAGKNVTIPAGAEVLLDVDTPVLSGLMVEGTLVFEDKPGVGLSAHHIMIMGTSAKLSVGTPSAPYVNQTHITLHGTDSILNVTGEPAPWNSGNKFLMPMDGGTLSLHGATRAKKSWTKISANAAVGATTIQVVDSVTATGWQVGDRLAIAPSGYFATEAQEVQITAISGRNITFTPALLHPRFGDLQTYGGQTIDQRPPVGLLTRNIKVRGAADSDAERFGAHVMVMGGLGGRPTAKAYIEGVEFSRSGQAGKQGRYTFHWHWVGDATGQYFRNNSVHHAFQRAVNVHRTSGVLVEDNVAFQVQNHNYVWAEDGHETEFNNLFRRNLAIQVIQPELVDMAFGERDSGGLNGQTTQEEWRTSGFWGRNLPHTLVDNYVSGVQGGMGYFFDVGNSDAPEPKIAFFRFQNNTAAAGTDRHSGLSPFNDLYPPLVRGVGLFVRNRNAGDLDFTGFQGFKNKLGVWTENASHTVRGPVLADNGGAIMPLLSRVEDALIVGASANTYGHDVRVRNTATTEIGAVRAQFAGILTFPGQGGLKHVRAQNVRVFNAHSAITVHDNSSYFGGYFSGITTDSSTLPVSALSLYHGAMLDADGLLDTATPRRPTWVTFGDPWFINVHSTYNPRLAAWVTPELGRLIRPASASAFLPYGPVAGSVALTDARLGVRATGPGGWALPVDYTVTPDTILEFTARENHLHGEELWHYAGLGLDEDLNPANGRRLFGLEKNQDNDLQNRPFPGYSVEEVKPFQAPNLFREPGRTYRIPVGRFYTGQMRYLVFYGDARTRPELAEFALRNIRLVERRDIAGRGWMVRREKFPQLSRGADNILTFADLYADSRYPASPAAVTAHNPYYGEISLITHDETGDVFDAHPTFSSQAAAVVDHSYFVSDRTGLHSFYITTSLTNYRLELGEIAASGTTWRTVLEQNTGSPNRNLRREGTISLEAGRLHRWRFTTVSNYAAAPHDLVLEFKRPGEAVERFSVAYLRPAANDLRPEPNMLADADSDGIDDTWELQAGLDPLSASGANGGSAPAAPGALSPLARFLYGLSPFAPATVPATEVTSAPGGGLNVAFHAIPGRRYQLETSNNLITWQPVGYPETTEIAGGEIIEWVIANPPTPRAFFRVQVTPKSAPSTGTFGGTGGSTGGGYTYP